MPLKTFKYFIILLLLSSSCISAKRLLQVEEKAIDYLGRSEVAFDYQFLYNHLRPSFGWKQLDNHSRFLAFCANASSIDGKKNEVTLIRNYRRLIEPSFTLEKKYLDEAIGLDRISLQALYCDSYPINEKSYFASLDSISSLQEYEITHSLLALYLLEKQGCSNSSELRELKNKLQARNIDLVTKTEDSLTDIAIESIALLQATGRKVSKKWIKEIIEEQRPDGGWTVDQQNELSNPHTTILSLWAIAGYRLK